MWASFWPLGPLRPLGTTVLDPWGIFPCPSVEKYTFYSGPEKKYTFVQNRKKSILFPPTPIKSILSDAGRTKSILFAAGRLGRRPAPRQPDGACLQASGALVTWLISKGELRHLRRGRRRQNGFGINTGNAQEVSLRCPEMSGVQDRKHHLGLGK